MIISCDMPQCWKRCRSIIGTTAAAKAMLSCSGRPESLSMSGNMPETPHSPPASRQVGQGTPYIRYAAPP